MKLKQLQGLMPSSRERQQHTLALAFLHELSQPDTPATPPSSARWDDLMQTPDAALGRAVNAACHACLDTWPHALDGFFDRVDFTDASPRDIRDAARVLTAFARQPGGHPLTRLGDIYQHGRSLNTQQWQGAFFTPWPVAEMMVMMNAPQPGMFIADISGCGAAVFLCAALQQVRDRYGERLAKTITLIGCDLDAVTCQVARASLLLAGADEDQFWIACGNSLARPIVGRDRADGQLKTLNFPLLLGNPPFGTATKIADLEQAALAGPLVVPDRVLNRAFVVAAHEKRLLADHGQRPIHRALAEADGRLFSGFAGDDGLLAA